MNSIIKMKQVKCKIGKIVFFISIISFVISCKVSRDIPSPNFQPPATFRNTEKDTNTVATVHWEDFFKELELKELIANALANNNDLQIAVKNIEAADLLFRQSRLGNIPSINALATASTSRPSDNSLNGFTLNNFLNTNHIEDYSIAANLSWEADIWGKISSRKSAALSAYLQTQEARKVIQTKIINNIAKGYYNLLILDAQLEISKKNVVLNDNVLTIINFQYQSGQVTSLAVQQAKAQKNTAQAMISRFEQEIALQENAISMLTGSYPGNIAHKARLSDLTVSEELKAGVPTALFSNRPDIKAAELALAEANANVGYAKANMYPSIVITAQGGVDALKASNWFNIPASLFGLIAGGVTQPIFQHKQLKTQYEVQKIRREQNVISFRQTFLIAVGEVSDNLIKLNKLQERETFVRERTLTLEQAITNANALFANGMANYLEVITAQANVLQSELELYSIKKELLDARVDLYKSVGGGWKQ